VIDRTDTPSRFFLPGQATQPNTAELALSVLRHAWDRSQLRQHKPDHEWTADLGLYLAGLVEIRVERVREWISSNLARFKTSHANIEALRRSLETAIVDLNENIQLCGMQCGSCHLLCIRNRRHEGSHHCQTSHECVHICDFMNEHPEEQKLCGFRYSSIQKVSFIIILMYCLSAGHPGSHM